MSNTTPNSAEPPITLPVLALVFFVVFWPIGFVLAIVSIVKFQSARGTTARTLAIVALVMNILLPIPMCGILAAIAVPNFVKFQCRSKQSEAKGNLKALYVAEESSRADVDTYSTDPRAIEFTPRGQKLRYTYTILSATKDAFSAEARGTGDMDGDLWTIDEKNALTNVSNSCER
jgi:type IV pilus assembly protein PilA